MRCGEHIACRLLTRETTLSNSATVLRREKAENAIIQLSRQIGEGRLEFRFRECEHSRSVRWLLDLALAAERDARRQAP